MTLAPGTYDMVRKQFMSLYKVRFKQSSIGLNGPFTS